MEQAILYSFLAGVVGTGLGGLLACHMGGKQQDLAGLLYFTAGVMMGMAFFDLLPEAVEHSPLWLVGLGLLGGAGFVALAEGVEHMRRPADRQGGAMLSAGFIIMLALMLHNLPEGFVIGAAQQDEVLRRAGLIALHNVPGGMAAALPLMQGGWKKGRAVAFSALCGLPLMVGAVLGAMAGHMPPLWLSLCLSVAAGSMLFAAAFELTQTKAEGKRGVLLFLLLCGVLLALLLSVGHTHAH